MHFKGCCTALVESLSVTPEISGMAYSHSQYILVQENQNLWHRKNELSTRAAQGGGGGGREGDTVAYDNLYAFLSCNCLQCTMSNPESSKSIGFKEQLQ